MSYLDQITVGSTTYDLQDSTVPSWAKASAAPVTSVNGQTGDVTISGGGSVYYYPSQSVAVATNAEMFRITNSAFSSNTICLNCVFDNSTFIIGQVDWVSDAGYVAFNGTCTAVTTADVILADKTN